MICFTNRGNTFFEVRTIQNPTVRLRVACGSKSRSFGTYDADVGWAHTLSPNFFRGSSDENDKVVGEKCLFFVELLKTDKNYKKPLKIFKNRQLFEKGPQKFFAYGGFFLPKEVGQFFESGRS